MGSRDESSRASRHDDEVKGLTAQISFLDEEIAALRRRLADSPRQARLLEDITAIEDLERVRILFDALERGESFVRLLELANGASGVQIFIGADNPLFANTGCSMVVAPFRDSQERILGAIGVIGPTRLNYARIIPLVDYTARAIGRMVG